MDPVTLMEVGTGLQVAGGLFGNLAQAEAERKTARFFQEQSEFARASMFRELQIADRQYAYRLGAQASAIAKGGADVGSGSAVNIQASTLAAKVEELLAIRKKGELDIKLARLRGDNAAQTADTLSSVSYNVAKASGTVLTNLALAADSRSPSGGTASVISTGSGGLQPVQTSYLGTIGD